MTLAARKRELVGIAEPRIAPPLPARSKVKEFTATARRIGISLYPWQKVAARYITALGPDGRWLYPEIAIVVGRQNGKTELLKPLILMRLQAGRRIMHSAQNRELPREVYGGIADLFLDDPTLLASRNGRVLKPRFSNGQEEIRLDNKGLYRIVAPTRGGARGPANDDVLVDELREMTDNEFLAAAEPTLFASDNPQIIYLSNAGEDDSAPLNALRERADEDPSLAYLEWSADESRDAGDREGWREANPSVGHNPTAWTYLERKYESYRLAGTMEIFETEHLCRWVRSMVSPLVTDLAWQACRTEKADAVGRPAMAVAADPSGTRVSAALAWRSDDGSVICQVARDFEDPAAVDMAAAGKELRQLSARHRVRDIGYSGISDQALARHLPRARAVDGRLFSSACGTFSNLVNGHQLQWAGDDLIGQDLKHLRRHPQADGTSVAMKAEGGPPVTAALAAIRAVWLATAPRQVPRIG